MKKKIYSLIILSALVIGCTQKKSNTIGVLDYNTDPKELYDLDHNKGATKILMSKYVEKGEYLYYLAGDLWIKSDKRFYVGDTLNFFSVQEVSNVEIKLDTTKNERATKSPDRKNQGTNK